jgi:hypothetical protein
MRAARTTRARRAPSGLTALVCSLVPLAGCAGGGDDVLADLVIDAPGAGAEGFADPARATNGVRGGGLLTGSLDVYSLDYRERRSLVLGFSGHALVDGPGVDLVVFENGFREARRDAWFMDPLVVEVSADGAEWLAFPHDYLADDETRYEPRPEAWRGFAGLRPVLLHAERNAVDPFDAAQAGGDGLDLADLATEPQATDAARALAAQLREHGVRYVRLTSAAVLENPDTGAPYPRDPVSDGADIDGVAARYLVPWVEPR